MSFKIRPITENDIDGYHYALDVVARERKYLTFLQAPPKEQTRSFVLHNMTHSVPQYVADNQSEIIGWCDVCPKRQEIFKHCAVLGMGVLPEHRKNGVGAALIESSLGLAFQQKIVRVELSVFADNDRAIRLYKKFGFRVEGELRDDAVIDGHYKNSLVMAVIRH